MRKLFLNERMAWHAITPARLPPNDANEFHKIELIKFVPLTLKDAHRMSFLIYTEGCVFN